MEHRGVSEDSSTISSHSQAHNSSLSQDNQNRARFSFFLFFFFFLYIFNHVPSRHISSTPEVFLFTNSINFHNSPMRQIKLLAPVR